MAIINIEDIKVGMCFLDTKYFDEDTYQLITAVDIHKIKYVLIDSKHISERYEAYPGNAGKINYFEDDNLTPLPIGYCKPKIDKT